jgi:hypothetical protein
VIDHAAPFEDIANCPCRVTAADEDLVERKLPAGWIIPQVFGAAV